MTRRERERIQTIFLDELVHKREGVTLEEMLDCTEAYGDNCVKVALEDLNAIFVHSQGRFYFPDYTI